MVPSGEIISPQQVATGAWDEGPPSFDTAGASDGVYSPLALLGRDGTNRDLSPGTAVVVGPTQAGLAAARTLRRSGRNEVVLVGRRPVDTWACDVDDLGAAREEGVTLRGELHVVRVEVDQEGRVTAVVSDQEDRLEAGLVITDAQRRPQVPAGLARTPLDTVLVDDAALTTSISGVFAAGEVVTGAKTVVEALAAGKRAAAVIERYLNGEPLSSVPPRRQEPGELAVISTKRGVAPVEEGDMSPLAVARASARCLRCGPCAECHTCEPGCPHERAVLPAGDGEGRREDLVYRAPAGEVSHEELLAASVESELCTGCGQCEGACPHHAVVVRFTVGGGATAVVDRPGCRGCGRCVAACPFGAIDLPRAHHGWPRLRQALCEAVQR